MLFQGGPILDQYVVHEDLYPLQPLKRLLHFPLEDLWSARDPERKPPETISPKWHDKYGKTAAIWMERDLPESAGSI